MLTGSNSRRTSIEARKAGAAGYVTKDRIATELMPAIHDRRLARYPDAPCSRSSSSTSSSRSP